jgi:hypothetical protein
LELEGFEDGIIEKETHGNNLVQAKDKRNGFLCVLIVGPYHRVTWDWLNG